MKLRHLRRFSNDAARFQIRCSRPKLSLIVLAAGILLAPFAERSSAQITVGGSNPITVSGTFGVSASSTAVVSASSIPNGTTVTGISVNFTNLNVANLNSVAIALKSPGGTALDLVSGVCDSANATLTLADTGVTGPDNVGGLVPF